VDSSPLTHYGRPTEYVYSEPDLAVLEAFPSPFANPEGNPHGVQPSVHIEVPEFTSLCPVTGKPNFATIIIDYVPRERCVESKSLHLYMGRFRQHGEFQEACVNRIANDLITLLDPESLRVEGRYAPRGGIPLWPVATYRRSAE
jgi:7-cyano-7-deazaguanine reductase